MTPEMSLYLDFVRLGAALIVVVWHVSTPMLGGTWLTWLKSSNIGPDAVMVFFVLSGFVIAYVSAEKEKTLRVFAVSRLARLWSVLVPALVLTWVADSVGMWIDPTPYNGWGVWAGWDYPLIRLIVSALFVNELWFLSVSPLSNGPVWSLGFEFWYYVLFGIAAYTRGVCRALFCLVASLIAGPKILLLMPCWIMGVALFYTLRAISVNRRIGLILFIAPLLIYIVSVASGVPSFARKIAQHLLSTPMMDALKYAQSFIWFYFVAGLAAVHFVGFSALQLDFSFGVPSLARLVRRGAGYTLSIYLFHHPLLLLSAAVLGAIPDGPTRTLLMLAAVLMSIACLGGLVEPQRHPLKAALLKLTGISNSSPGKSAEEGAKILSRS